MVDLLREAHEQLRFGRKRTYPGKETYINYRRVWNQRILFLYPGLGMGRHSVSGMFSGARGTTQQIFLMAWECFDKWVCINWLCGTGTGTLFSMSCLQKHIGLIYCCNTVKRGSGPLYWSCKKHGKGNNYDSEYIIYLFILSKPLLSLLQIISGCT